MGTKQLIERFKMAIRNYRQTLTVGGILVVFLIFGFFYWHYGKINKETFLSVFFGAFLAFLGSLTLEIWSGERKTIAELEDQVLKNHNTLQLLIDEIGENHVICRNLRKYINDLPSMPPDKFRGRDFDFFFFPFRVFLKKNAWNDIVHAVSSRPLLGEIASHYAGIEYGNNLLNAVRIKLTEQIQTLPHSFSGDLHQSYRKALQGPWGEPLDKFLAKLDSEAPGLVENIKKYWNPIDSKKN